MEYQSVILCGPGKKLHPISSSLPKALLPIGNKPMVQYPVEWCNKAGFCKTIIAVPEQDFDTVSHVCAATGLKAEVHLVPNGTNSGQILKILRSEQVINPNQDVVVLPCDFITDVDPEELISRVRTLDDDIIVSGFHYQNNLETLDLKVLDPDVLFLSAINDNSVQLLLDAYERRSVREAKVLKARMAMLWKFPEVIAKMDLLRSSIFFFHRDVLEYEDIDFDKPISKVVTSLARRTWQHRKQQEKVATLQIPVNNTLFLRANNLPAYMEANRYTLRLKARQAHQNQTQNQNANAGGANANGEDRKKEPGQAAIGNDSLVGPGTVVGERSSVKRTSIGERCTIGKKCRLNGCVILDGVSIGNDVSLENCIIGEAAIIENKCKLVGCSVEGKYTVVSETEGKNEVLKGLSMVALGEDEFSDVYESTDDLDETDDTDEESEDTEDYDFDDGEDDIFDRS